MTECKFGADDRDLAYHTFNFCDTIRDRHPAEWIKLQSSAVFAQTQTRLSVDVSNIVKTYLNLSSYFERLQKRADFVNLFLFSFDENSPVFERAFIFSYELGYTDEDFFAKKYDLIDKANEIIDDLGIEAFYARYTGPEVILLFTSDIDRTLFSLRMER